MKYASLEIYEICQVSLEICLASKVFVLQSIATNVSFNICDEHKNKIMYIITIFYTDPYKNNLDIVYLAKIRIAYGKSVQCGNSVKINKLRISYNVQGV